jgi:hypothetical protein
MNENFNFEAPSFTPPSGDDGAFNTNINQPKNAPASERMTSWQKAIKRSHSTRKAVNVVLKSREELAKYLLERGIKLLTSAIIFQQTGDFILASKLRYLNHGSSEESLLNFLKRYPELQQTVNAIKDSLRKEQNNMQVISNFTTRSSSELLDSLLK